MTRKKAGGKPSAERASDGMPPRTDSYDHPLFAEVIGWFQDNIKARTVPDEAAVSAVVDDLLLCEQLAKANKLLYPHWGTIGDSIRLMRGAAPTLQAARTSLAAAIALIDGIGDTETSEHLAADRRLLAELDGFLARHPPRRAGRSERAWSSAPLFFWWVRDVRAALISAGWENASVTNDEGAVPYVLSKMIGRVFKENVTPKSVARYLRSPEARREMSDRQKSSEAKSQGRSGV